MARKTNKTAHVLNLLAAGTADENEQKEADSAALAPNISIVDNPTSSADPLAGLIRNTLNKEILQEDAEPESEAASKPKTKASAKSATKSDKEDETEETAELEEALAPDEPAPIKKKKTTAKSKTSKASETAEQVAAIFDKSVFSEAKSEAEPQPVEEMAAADSADTAPQEQVILSAVSLPEPEIESPAPMAENTPPEPEDAVPAPESESAEAQAAKEYIYLNMMDILVEERLMEFLNKFGACTCHRCVLDAKALALSNLPPKYLVIPESSSAPLTSFYRNKFSIYIITELTKACLAIINSPRH